MLFNTVMTLLKIIAMWYMVVYIYIHHNMQSTMMIIGAILDFIEIILTGFSFYAPVVGSGYTTHASWIAMLLGDIFHVKDLIYFSIGDIIMFIGIWLSL